MNLTCYKKYFNLQDATFTRIEHPDAIVADVYKITESSGKELILKICSRPQDFFKELYFLNYFTGKLPVPHIIRSFEPQADITGAILMECLPGAILKITEVTDSLAFEMGSLLARINQNRTTGYGNFIAPDSLVSNPTLYFAQKFEERFSECKDHLPLTLMGQCRQYYNAHIELLDTVDGPCIIHGDFRPGNIIAHNGRLQGIIDWSSTRSSFAEESFCPLEHAEWSIHSASKKSFLAGYASIRPVPDYQHIMPLLRISRALDIIGFTLKRNTWQNKHNKLYHFNRQFLESFLKN
ncbi:MAG: hypothetical protein AMXMBFR12_09120 [Candidatus Babeliales bacterium]